MITHAYVEFLWVASGTTLYKLDAATLELAEGTNSIDLSDETLYRSDPIKDLAFGGGDLYVHVYYAQYDERVLRVNPSSGEVTRRVNADGFAASTALGLGLAYEIQPGDDAIWYFVGSSDSTVRRIYKSEPPLTRLNRSLGYGQFDLGGHRKHTDVRGMDYYENALWILNTGNSTVYEVTDNLMTSNQSTPATVADSTVLQDSDGTTLTSLRGMAIGGGYLWSIRSNGRLYKHNISDLSFDSESDISGTGATRPVAMCYQAGE